MPLPLTPPEVRVLLSLQRYEQAKGHLHNQGWNYSDISTNLATGDESYENCSRILDNLVKKGWVITNKIQRVRLSTVREDEPVAWESPCIQHPLEVRYRLKEQGAWPEKEWTRQTIDK